MTIECHKKPHEPYQNKDEINQCLEGHPVTVIIEEVDNDLRYAVMHQPPGRSSGTCVGHAHTLTGVLSTIKAAMGQIFYDDVFMKSKLKQSKSQISHD